MTAWTRGVRMVALALIVGCGPAQTGEDAAARAGEPTPAGEPAAPAQPLPTEPVVTAERPVTPPGAVDEPGLGGVVVRTVQEGPWTRRTVVPDARGEVPTLARDAPADAFEGGLDGLDGLGGLGGGGMASGGRGAAPQSAKRTPDAAPLRAGRADDNADYRGFLRFLTEWSAKPAVRGEYQPIDVRARGFVRVLDGDGRPVPGARLTLHDPTGQAPLWEATTYGDGRAPYYPHLYGAKDAPKRLEVTVDAGGELGRGTWDGAGEQTLRLAQPREDGPLTLEVLFLIDTTGSMGDEIDQIKASLLSVTGAVRARRDDLTLRYGAVLYRDVGDDYLTMAHPFTADVEAFNAALQTVTAGGGGDIPEALNQGLDRAVEGVAWQADAARLVFLVCDAAPKMRVKGDVPYGDSAARALSRGLRIHAVAASGLDPLGTLVLRQIAQLTRGQFIFIEYGGSKASAARHGVAAPADAGNNLGDILRAQIVAEVDGWGR